MYILRLSGLSSGWWRGTRAPLLMVRVHSRDLKQDSQKICIYSVCVEWGGWIHIILHYRLIKIQFGSWFEKQLFIPSNEFFKLVRSVLLGGNSNSLIYSSPARIGKKLIKNIYWIFMRLGVQQAQECITNFQKLRYENIWKTLNSITHLLGTNP